MHVLELTCCGPLPAAPRLVREAEEALGAQAAGQRRHYFRLPAAVPRAVVLALRGGAAAVPTAAAGPRCRVDGSPQAAWVEAPSARVCDVSASSDYVRCPSRWRLRCCVHCVRHQTGRLTLLARRWDLPETMTPTHWSVHKKLEMSNSSVSGGCSPATSCAEQHYCVTNNTCAISTPGR